MQKSVSMKQRIMIKHLYLEESWDEMFLHTRREAIEQYRKDLLHLYPAMTSDNQRAYAIAKIEYFTNLLKDRAKLGH